MIHVALAALVLTQSYYSKEEAEALFSQGNDAYTREDYAAAQKAYEGLLDHGLDSVDVLYNAGTAALARGALGHAVLYLERASDKSSGENPDLDANLALARSKQLDQVQGAGTERTFLQRLVVVTDERHIAVALLVFSFLGFGLLLLFHFLKPGRRGWVRAAGAFFVVIALVSAGLLGAHAWVAQNVREAVVVASTVAARELPRVSARTAFELHAGLKVRVLDAQAGFVKVRLPNGLEGWTERDGLADL